jgi:hypothetical protein
MRCSPLKVNQRLEGACRLHLQIEKHAEQETCMKQPTTYRYVLEDAILRHCRCENFTPYIVLLLT